MNTRSRIYLITLALAVAAVGLVLSERATAMAGKLDPSGTWKLTCTRDGRTLAYKPTLKLQLVGEKLSGTLTRRQGDHEVEMILHGARIEARELSFMVIVTPDLRSTAKTMRRYHGKVSYDAIKQGTLEEDYRGVDSTVAHPVAWEGVRAKN